MRMVTLDWLGQVYLGVAVWRCVIVMLGALCVMTCGASMMVMWLVDSSDSLEVFGHNNINVLVHNCFILLQLTMWFPEHILDKVLETFS